MMDLHTKYLQLVAAYVLSYSPRQAHGAALGSYVVPRQYLRYAEVRERISGTGRYSRPIFLVQYLI